jgi:hypothetical protein
MSDRNDPAPTVGAIEQVLVAGDLAKLTTEQRVAYYDRVCASLSLNPLTRPFDYIVLNGRLQLYARKDATEQLRKRDAISIIITARELIGEVYVVTAKARTPDGREDEDQGAVFVGNLKGEALANAYLKACTKAKRRVTLSICGLGVLDETEVADVPEARPEAAAAPALPAPVRANGPSGLAPAEEGMIREVHRRLGAHRRTWTAALRHVDATLVFPEGWTEPTGEGDAVDQVQSWVPGVLVKQIYDMPALARKAAS